MSLLCVLMRREIGNDGVVCCWHGPEPKRLTKVKQINVHNIAKAIFSRFIELSVRLRFILEKWFIRRLLSTCSACEGSSMGGNVIEKESEREREEWKRRKLRLRFDPLPSEIFHNNSISSKVFREYYVKFLVRRSSFVNRIENSVWMRLSLLHAAIPVIL